MNNEVEGRGYTKVHVLSLYLTGKTEENHENVSQDGQSLGGWDFNLGPTECEVTVPSTSPQHSVWDLYRSGSWKNKLNYLIVLQYSVQLWG